MDGLVKVGDFGLVTASEEQCQEEHVEVEDRRCGLHRHTAQVGTKMYMSPEQVNYQQIFQHLIYIGTIQSCRHYFDFRLSF